MGEPVPRREWCCRLSPDWGRVHNGLTDALNEAVADAVKDAVGQAVREAVQAVVAELVANPDVARAVAAAHGLTTPTPPTPPPPEPQAGPRGPSLWERLAARGHRLRSGVAAVKDRVVMTVFDRLRTTWMVLTAAVRLARADRRGVTLSTLVGVLVAVGGHLCGPAVAATVGGVSTPGGLRVACELPGHPDPAGEGPGAHPPHHPPAVHLDRPQRQPEGVGDLLVHPPPHDQVRHHTSSTGFVSGAYFGKKWTCTRPPHASRYARTALLLSGRWLKALWQMTWITR